MILGVFMRPRLGPRSPPVPPEMARNRLESSRTCHEIGLKGVKMSDLEVRSAPRGARQHLHPVLGVSRAGAARHRTGAAVLRSGGPHDPDLRLRGLGHDPRGHMAFHLKIPSKSIQIEAFRGRKGINLHQSRAFSWRFTVATSSLGAQVENLTSRLEWQDVGATLSTLTRLSFGAMDLGSIQSVAKDSPLLIVVLVVFMMLVYSFFFNLLVSPPDGVLRAVMGLSTTLLILLSCIFMDLFISFVVFCLLFLLRKAFRSCSTGISSSLCAGEAVSRQFCGVFTSLAADIKGHARRGTRLLGCQGARESSRTR